jgi:hypothetical protein
MPSNLAGAMHRAVMLSTLGARLDGLDREGLLSPGALPTTRRQTLHRSDPDSRD